MKIKISIILILIAGLIFVSATSYDIVIDPYRISSSDMGYREAACSAAVTAGILMDVKPQKSDGSFYTENEIIDYFKTQTSLNATNGLTTEEYMNAMISIFNRDARNRYEIKLYRIKNYTDPPVLNKPSPQITHRGNVEIIEYKPYNFNNIDIYETMMEVKTTPNSGMGLGAVYYVQNDTTGIWEDKSAHMFRAVALSNTAQTFPMSPNNYYYNATIYDPYYDRDTETLIDKEGLPNGRTYISLWSSEWWFHLEDMLFAKKIAVPRRPFYPEPPEPPRPTLNPGEIQGIKQNFIFSSIGSGFCGDNICDSSIGENCDNCFTDCDILPNGSGGACCGDGTWQSPNEICDASAAGSPSNPPGCLFHYICPDRTSLWLQGTCNNNCGCDNPPPICPVQRKNSDS